MITKTTITNAFKKGAERTWGVSGSALILESLAELRNLAEEVIAERDAALKEAENEFQEKEAIQYNKRWFQEQLHAAEARAEAYREVAIKFKMYFMYGVVTPEKIDAVANKLLNSKIKGDSK